jgi:hypothetical protein
MNYPSYCRKSVISTTFPRMQGVLVIVVECSRILGFRLGIFVLACMSRAENHLLRADFSFTWTLYYSLKRRGGGGGGGGGVAQFWYLPEAGICPYPPYGQVILAIPSD